MRERLTKKQRKLFEYIETFIQENSYAPSYREMMQALGYKSVSTVATHVQSLIVRGYLRKTQDEARSLEIVPIASAADSHQAWLKRLIARKQSVLREKNTATSRQDIVVLERARELLGLE